VITNHQWKPNNSTTKKTNLSEQDDNPAEEDEEEDEESTVRIALLESRILNCEHASGIPNRHAPLGEKIQTLIVFQTYYKLLKFGNAALPIAILELQANIAFVVSFTIHQQRNTCVPNASLLDGDLSAFANRAVFKDS
jgi:hypothetical protein